jgi:alpha-N-arabinofuranosidase
MIICQQCWSSFGLNWNRYDLLLTLDRASEFRYSDSPFGEYRLSLIADADGESTVDLDWVMLTSGDAVEGLFNRATIEQLKLYNVTSIRWGGNYANEYNWKDGIGPWQQRPVRDNQNWGGLEPNYLGTNEFLRFCQLIEAEPFLNVGFSCDLPPELAAEWVEYVNGDITTPMGRLRAEHGYPEPWGVKLWQVGNESYGDYQFGYTNSIDFSKRIQTYYTMMKKIDPSISIIMAGEDPMYVDYSEIPGQPPLWNKRMFEIAGPAYIDGLDIHQYTRGIRDEGLRKEWLASNTADPSFYNQVLVSYPTQYEAIIQELKELAKGYEFEPLALEIGEWNLEPETDMNWPKAEYETMAHACYVSSMLNTFIRQGDAIKYAYQRDNTLYYRAYPVDMRPVNPGNDTSRFYAEPFLRADTNWRRLEIQTEGSSFTMPQTWVRIRPMEQVPHVDAAAVISDRNDEIILFLVNRDLSFAHTVHVEGEWSTGEVKSSVLLQYSDSPFLRHTDWYVKKGSPSEASLDGKELMNISLMVPQYAEIGPSNDSPLVKKLNEKLNIKLDIQWIPGASYNDKISVLAASNSLPDVYRIATQDYLQWRDRGVFLDVKPYLKEYPNLTKQLPEAAWMELNPEDSYYGIPHLFSMSIRKDWLDKLNLKVPETVDEFYNVAKAFVTQDPDGNGKADTTGFSILVNANGTFGNAAFLQGAFGLGNEWALKDGKLVAMQAQREELKGFIGFLRKAFAEGVMDKDFLVMKPADARNKLWNGRSGIQLLNPNEAIRLDIKHQEECTSSRAYSTFTTCRAYGNQSDTNRWHGSEQGRH